MEANKMTDQLLDAAACEAIGAHTREESAAYQHELAAAGATAVAVDKQLRQTVAALSAASPHMNPSSDLRARILHATAPKTFRLEDYKKTSREENRYYKWGFYAAAMFLVMGALYNISVKSALDKTTASYNNLREQAMGLAKNDEQKTAILNVLLNANGSLDIVDESKRPFARAILDVRNRRAIMVMPQEMAVAGVQPQLALEDTNGQKLNFQTMILTGPANELQLVVPPNAQVPEKIGIQSSNGVNQIRNAGSLRW